MPHLLQGFGDVQAETVPMELADYEDIHLL
jgi:hypothetical protein